MDVKDIGEKARAKWKRREGDGVRSQEGEKYRDWETQISRHTETNRWREKYFYFVLEVILSCKSWKCQSG